MCHLESFGFFGLMRLLVRLLTRLLARLPALSRKLLCDPFFVVVPRVPDGACVEGLEGGVTGGFVLGVSGVVVGVVSDEACCVGGLGENVPADGAVLGLAYRLKSQQCCHTGCLLRNRRRGTNCGCIGRWG